MNSDNLWIFSTETLRAMLRDALGERDKADVPDDYRCARDAANAIAEEIADRG